MGKGSGWDLKRIQSDAIAIGAKLADETNPQGPAIGITNAEAQWLVTWVNMLITEWPKKGGDVN